MPTPLLRQSKSYCLLASTPTPPQVKVRNQHADAHHGSRSRRDVTTHGNRETPHMHPTSTTCATSSQDRIAETHWPPHHTQRTNTGGAASRRPRSRTSQEQRLQLRHLAQRGCQRRCSLGTKLIVCLQARHSHTAATKHTCTSRSYTVIQYMYNTSRYTTQRDHTQIVKHHTMWHTCNHNED